VNLGFTSRSRHLRSICIVPWFARSPRVAWRTWWRSVFPDRARARARRLVVRVACGGCDVVVRCTRSDGGVGTLCFAVRFLLLINLRSVNLCEVFSWARDGLGGSGAFLCAHRAVGEDPTSRPTSGTSTHYFHTRCPLLLVAQRRGLPYLTYADRRAKLARPNLSLTWFSTGCEALAAVATFRVNMRSSVSRRATS
jgi:hypothetical protein